MSKYCQYTLYCLHGVTVKLNKCYNVYQCCDQQLSYKFSNIIYLYIM